MSDNSQNIFNPGVKKPVRLATATPPVTTQAPISQIRGTAAKGSTGAGIPKHVTDVTAAISNAVAGTTSTVTVTFKRDPSDTSFSRVNVYVKGYQGNQALVQIGGGSESPVTFVLNNTSESVQLVVQSQGNAGSAPLSTAPSTGIKLPKSSAGGYSTSTAITAPTQLTGDVTTVGNASPLTATVVGIEGTGVSSSTPNRGDTFRFNEYGDNKWDVVIGMPRRITVTADGSQGPVTEGNGNGPAAVGTRTLFAANGTEFNGWTYTSAATASTQTVIGLWQGFGASVGSYTYGPLRRFSARCIMGSTANVRYWLGFVNQAPGANSFYSTDTPAQPYAAFRFSSGTDTTIKAACGTDASHQTVVDTGVSVDTANSHLFDIAYTGSGFKFYIDGVLKATITTNIPSATTVAGNAFLGDNKNTATAIALTVFYWHLTLK